MRFLAAGRTVYDLLAARAPLKRRPFHRLHRGADWVATGDACHTRVRLLDAVEKKGHRSLHQRIAAPLALDLLQRVQVLAWHAPAHLQHESDSVSLC